MAVSYIEVLLIPIPQKMAKACTTNSNTYQKLKSYKDRQTGRDRDGQTEERLID